MSSCTALSIAFFDFIKNVDMLVVAKFTMLNMSKLLKLTDKLGLSCAKLSTCWDQCFLIELVKFAVRYNDEVKILVKFRTMDKDILRF